MTRGEFLRLALGAAGGGAMLSASASDLFALRPVVAGSGPAVWEAVDAVLVNGVVATMDALGTTASAVAIRDGVIHSVGSTAEVMALTGPTTTVVDLGGRTVTPGFIDAHCHFSGTGLLGTHWLPFIPPVVSTIPELVEALAGLVPGLTDDEWVNGYYLIFTEGRSPSRHDLDPVSAENPVFLMQQGGHWASVNSRALAIAGITGDTPDPPGGVIERDGAGEPTGVLYNHRAMDLVRRFIPLYEPSEIEASILATQPLFAACGLTGFHDVNIRALDMLDTYQRVAAEGRMYQRQSLFYTLEWPSDVERALALDLMANDFTRHGGFKFLIDGQGPTFYCHEPHGGTAWDMPTWDPDQFKEAVAAVHDTGLQVCVHCGGDAAVDLALDAFEEAMNRNPRPDPRHRLEHAVVTTPASTQRIKDLGVVVSTQPQFLRQAGDLYVDLLSAEQSGRLIMTREWLEAGIPVALGSDTPTTLWYQPRATLYGAMTRLSMSDQVIGPDQVMTVTEALRAHTIDAALAGHTEGVVGSLEEGKLADLVVWSADPFGATPAEVFRAAVDLTMVGGEIVYLGPRPPRRHLGG